MMSIGAVAIGRNEGERLRRCLESLVGRCETVVYVDSGSTDGSQEMAAALGVDVVTLDRSVPFTAARARNAGRDRLREIAPSIRYIQFVDGDCEVSGGWIERGKAELDAHPELAVVCGRRRERHPEQSTYNRLADLEWDTPVGDAQACGGDAMFRVQAFDQVGGYDPTWIAGEEPDLCMRLRAVGWKIRRVDAEMTLHDMAMTRLGQWWKRMVRAGYAFAAGAARYHTGPDKLWIREIRSVLFWGLVLPLVILVLAWPTRGWSLLLLLVYPLQYLRMARKFVRRYPQVPDTARMFALACLVACFAQTIGVMQYCYRRALGRESTLIEYKTT